MFKKFRENNSKSPLKNSKVADLAISRQFWKHWQLSTFQKPSDYRGQLQVNKYHQNIFKSAWKEMQIAGKIKLISLISNKLLNQISTQSYYIPEFNFSM